MSLQLTIGTTLQGGKYVIKKVLGQGGFGITYLAEQTMLGKLFAIKEFFIRDLCARDDTATVYSVTQSDMVDRYRQKYIKEAQIIARFNHPGIVRVSDIFEENDTVYYVMEYVEGENLDEIIKREGALPEERALGFIAKVADALDYIHQHNVNHLDIKPSNIMIRKADDEPILIDFGVSKQYDENKDQTTTTPPGVSTGYSPLEQYRPGGVSKFSPQADIYAMGATLYKMITGKTPPSASDLLNNGLPFPSGVSLNVKRAIEKAMQPRYVDRPRSTHDLMGLMTNFDKIKTIIDEENTIIVGQTNNIGRYSKPTVFMKKAILFSCIVLLPIIFVFLLVKYDSGSDKDIKTEEENPRNNVTTIEETPTKSENDKVLVRLVQPGNPKTVYYCNPSKIMAHPTAFMKTFYGGTMRMYDSQGKDTMVKVSEYITLSSKGYTLTKSVVDSYTFRKNGKSKYSVFMQSSGKTLTQMTLENIEKQVRKHLEAQDTVLAKQAADYVINHPESFNEQETDIAWKIKQR